MKAVSLIKGCMFMLTEYFYNRLSNGDVTGASPSTPPTSEDPAQRDSSRECRHLNSDGDSM